MLAEAVIEQLTTVLLIEDDAALRATVTVALHHHGFAVLEAPDGDVGVALARQHCPDLILSDVMMPNRDGYSVLRALRQHPETATTPFIFLTSNTQRDDLRQGMELGADDYVTKPFLIEELMAAIQTQLAKRKQLAATYDQPLAALRQNITYALPHEVYTPLQQVLGFSEILEMDSAVLPPEDSADMARAIHQAGLRLQRLFENYLVYAQIEVLAADPEQRAALRDHLTENATAEIARVAVEVAQRHGRSHDLVTDLVPVTLPISAANLCKIVEELVDNACKFSSPGTPVTLRAASDEADFVLRVHDLGRGMSPDQIRQVGAYMQFERAFHEQQGLGLGLAIASRLAELHQGHLDIQSAPDQGTTIQVRLPR